MIELSDEEADVLRRLLREKCHLVMKPMRTLAEIVGGEEVSLGFSYPLGRELFQTAP